MSQILSFPSEATNTELQKIADVVEKRENCLIINGSVTLGQMKHLAQSIVGEAVIDADATAALRAKAVLGSPQNINKY